MSQAFARQLAYPTLCVLGLMGAGCQARSILPPGRWVDLSHDFGADTVYWPTADPFKLEIVAEGVNEKGYFYAANAFCAAEHGGTHVDAPVHFAEGKWTLDQIPIERLIGSGIVVDVSSQARDDRDYQISVQDFLDWEAR
jgi:kynurenine formamidase